MDLERRKALIEIAKRGNCYFDCKKANYIFVCMLDPDYEIVLKYHHLFGGILYERGRLTPDTRNARSASLGSWEWNITGTEAYMFCKEIIEYLYIYDTFKYKYCCECIKVYEYENNQHQSLRA